MQEKREFDEIHGQMPSAKKIACHDCLYRDRATISVGGREIPVGVTRIYCDIFTQERVHTGKPEAVLFQNESCKFYSKDNGGD